MTYKVALSLILCLTVSVSYAANETSSEVLKLMDLSLRDLINVEVTLSSRKKESQFEAPSAIYTISREDIRRSGLRHIPEILRMVPGLHVAKLDNNTWAISSRNNLSRFSPTMLVMMDGRILYNNLFSGVYWDVQNTYIDDIERIEVIRGPGATLWGTNAVDGVINIVTRDAGDTRGTEIYAGAGSGEFNYETGFRYGGQPGKDTSARVYAKKMKTGTGEYLDAASSPNNGFFPVGDDAKDDTDFEQAGFRADVNFDAISSVTLQGDIYQGVFNSERVDLFGAPPVTAEINEEDASGYNFLARWNQQYSDNSSVSIQFYVDHASRDDRVFSDERSIYDLDMQHHFSIGDQQVSWGVGVRKINDDTKRTPTGIVFLVPPSSSDRIYSLFIQDRISFSDTFSLIVGSKFEHNNFSEGEFQPSIKALWKKNADTTIWGSISRAVRTQSRFERNGFADLGPGGIVEIGALTENEILVATELGLRHQFSRKFSIDISLFNNDYDNGANEREDAYGLEFVGKYLANQDWLFEISYAHHQAKDIDATTGALIENKLIPENSLNLRSLYTINERWQFDSYLYYIDDGVITDSSIAFPASTRLDFRLGWLPTRHWETSLLLSNILEDTAGLPLDPNTVNTINTDMPRSLYFQAKYLH